MKKIILSIGILIATLSVRGQENNAPESKSEESNGIAVGVRYGIGLNSVSIDPSSSANLGTRMSALNAALVLEKGFVDLFALQAELGLSDKGFNQKSGTTTIDASFKYLSLNLLPKIRFGNDKIEGFLLVGPGFDFKLSAAATANGTSTDLQNVAGLNISGIFGAGAAYKLSSGKIFIDARYNMGLTDVSNESPSAATAKLSQIGINLGYLHNF